MPARLTAISTRILRDRPVLETLPAFRQAGFDRLELCAGPGHFDPADLDTARLIRDRCTELDIEILSLHAPYSAPMDITVVQIGERKLAVQEVCDAARGLAALGGRYLVIHTGSNVPPGPHLDIRMQALSESLHQIHRLCGELGVKLLVEEMEPGVFGGRDQDLRLLTELTPRPFDGLCLDIVHSQLAGALLPRIEAYAGLIALVHVGDCRVPPSHEHLLPGDGSVPWPEVATHLNRHCPEAPAVLEVDGWGEPDAPTLQTARTRLSQALAG